MKRDAGEDNDTNNNTNNNSINISNSLKVKTDTNPDSAILLQTSKVKSITKSDNQANNNTGSDSVILLQTSKVKSTAMNFNKITNNNAKIANSLNAKIDTNPDSAIPLQTSDNETNNNTGSDSAIILQTSKVKSIAMNFNKITNNYINIANSLNAKIDPKSDSEILLQTSDNETNNNTGSNSTIILKTSKVKSIARNGNKVTTNNKNANTFITKTKISNTLKTSLIMLC